MGAKKIYPLEGGRYQIVNINGKKVVQFVHNGNVVQLARLRVYQEMSEETMCFSADVIFNGEFGGSCCNDGKGGCARLYAEYEFRQYAYNELRSVESYMFKHPDSVYDIMDQLASYQYIVNGCRNKTQFDNTYNWFVADIEQTRKDFKLKM